MFGLSVFLVDRELERFPTSLESALGFDARYVITCVALQ